MNGDYRRLFSRAKILDKIAYRTTLLGVPMTLAAANALGQMSVSLVVLFSFVLGSPDGATYGIATLFAAFGSITIAHLVMWKKARRDPHLESVWFNRVMRPATARRLNGGWFSRNARAVGRWRSRAIGRPPGRRYDV